MLLNLGLSPRSSFYEGRREVVDAVRLKELQTNGEQVRVVATEGQSYANEGHEFTVDKGNVLVVFDENRAKSERLF